MTGICLWKRVCSDIGRKHKFLAKGNTTKILEEKFAISLNSESPVLSPVRRPLPSHHSLNTGPAGPTRGWKALASFQAREV